MTMAEVEPLLSAITICGVKITFSTFSLSQDLGISLDIGQHDGQFLASNVSCVRTGLSHQ